MKIKTKLATMGIAILALPLLALVNLPHKVFGKVATVDKSRAEAKTNCGGVTDTGGEHPSGQK